MSVNMQEYCRVHPVWICEGQTHMLWWRSQSL